MNLLVDLVTMRTDIRPSVRKVLGMQRWVSLQQCRLGRTEAARLLQDPNRNPCADDGRLGATDARERVDPREGVPELLGYALEQLRLFTRGKAREQRICVDWHPKPPSLYTVHAGNLRENSSGYSLADLLLQRVGLELPILALIPGLGNVAWCPASDLR